MNTQIEIATQKLADRLGNSELAQQKISEFSNRVQERSNKILTEYSSTIEELNERNHDGLTERGMKVIEMTLKSLSYQRLARSARYLPRFCYRIAPAPKMPDKPIDQQSAKQLAKTLALSHAYIIDREFGKHLSNPNWNKIYPAVKRRILKNATQKFRTEWTHADLQTQAAFMNSALGRSSIEIGLKFCSILSEEAQATRKEYIAEAIAIKEADRLAKRPKDPTEAMLYDMQNAMDDIGELFSR